MSNPSKQISLVLFILMHILSQFLVQVNWRVAGGHCRNTWLLNRIDLILHSRYWDIVPVSEKPSHKRTQYSSAPVVSYLIAADRHECCYILTRDSSHSPFVSAPPSILSMVTRDNEMLEFCRLSSHPPRFALLAFWHETGSNFYPEPGYNNRKNLGGGRNECNRAHEVSIQFWRGMLHVGLWVRECVNNECDALTKLTVIFWCTYRYHSLKGMCMYCIDICLVFSERNKRE